MSLDRFVDAQRHSYERALAEIRAGCKSSHWMWYIFPQLDGLGASPTARKYALKNLAEARAYLQHPLLGKRLLQCCDALRKHRDLTAREIFGFPDELKLCSCLTLFAQVAPDTVFDDLIEQYFGAIADKKTLEMLAISQSG